MTKKNKTREEVKKELLDKCISQGVGRRPFKWIAENMYEMLNPKCRIVIDNFVFKLRFVKEYDTPFEEDQPEDADVTLSRINIEEYELETSPQDVALNMYLMLNPLNQSNGGSKYRLEDKKKEAEEALSNYELVDAAAEKIRNADLELAKAALHVLNGWDTIDMGSSEVRLELRKQAEYSPELVTKAFDDEKTAIKFKLFTCKRLGYLVVNDEDTTIRWGGSDKVFFTVPVGTNMAERFADYCLSDKGKSVLATMDEKLK